MRQAAVGVDIGGTNVKCGLVSEKGTVLIRRSFPTASGKGREAFLNILTNHIHELLAAARRQNLKVAGVGIGAPGPIDVERGFVYFFPNIPGWKNTPLKKILEKKLKRPVVIDNDANMMAYGEFCFGAGRGAKNIIALTLGTGIGGGIVLDGKLFHGHSYSAAEIGHLVINENGPRCACGNRGCIEAYVGNVYFVKEIERRLALRQKSILSVWMRKGESLTPELAARAARAGDAFAERMWEETGAHLGTALAGLVNILNPERIVIGGGIAGAGPLILNPVRKAISQKAFPIASRTVRVLPARLDNDAGLIGAAACIMEKNFCRVD